jgi:Ca2+/H+ antiporter
MSFWRWYDRFRIKMLVVFTGVALVLTGLFDATDFPDSSFRFILVILGMVLISLYVIWLYLSLKR